MADPKSHPNSSSESRPAAQRAWEPPSITELSRLTELTLTTGAGIVGTGGTGGGGSTVF